MNNGIHGRPCFAMILWVVSMNSHAHLDSTVSTIVHVFIRIDLQFRISKIRGPEDV